MTVFKTESRRPVKKLAFNLTTAEAIEAFGSKSLFVRLRRAGWFHSLPRASTACAALYPVTQLEAAQARLERGELPAINQEAQNAN